jgi:hypothetical protein
MKYDWQDMKFDCVVMNPPYQAEKHRVKGTNGVCGTILWDKFVQLAIDLTTNNGYICAVHPPGWRRPNKRSRWLYEKMTSRQMQYLEMHSVNDGIKTVGVTTPYDWYVLQNSPNTKATTVKDYDGQIHQIDLKKWSVLPNSQFNLVKKRLAKNDEEKCEILYSRSAYGTDKLNMSNTQHGDFIYPCVYSLPQTGIRLFYSNTNKNGHFGVPKVIFKTRLAQVIVDATGQYGLTQFAFGIVDKPKNLPKIKQAMESEKFLDFCNAFRFGHDIYDAAFIALFRKDFWKEFI